jgi:putative MATE family efflux protein
MMGTTNGASIVTAQRFGAADEAGVKRSFATSIVINAVVTIIIMTVSIACLKSILVLLNTPQEIITGAYEYFIIILMGMPALMFFNLFSSMMRAVGDSKTPLYFLITACIINIILDYTFILFFHSGVAGAGLATIIAQFLSALACIPVIIKKLPALKFSRDDFKFDAKEYWDHIRVALPVGFQWSIIAIGSVSVTFALNRLGYEAVAAFNVGQRIDQFAVMPLSSYGQAITTFTAQNYGARKYARLRTGAAQSAIFAVLFALAMGIVFVLFGRHLAAIFLKTNSAAIDLAHTYLKIVGCFFVFLAVLFIFRQTIQGLGNSLVPTISGIAELFMRAFAALFLTQYFGYTGLCFASPLAWVGCLIPLTIALIFIFKKLRRKEISEGKGKREQRVVMSSE